MAQKRVGAKVQTPEGKGTVLSVLDALHPLRTHNPTVWTYADGKVIEATTMLYVVTLGDGKYAVYTEDELLWG